MQRLFNFILLSFLAFQCFVPAGRAETRPDQKRNVDHGAAGEQSLKSIYRSLYHAILKDEGEKGIEEFIAKDTFIIQKRQDNGQLITISLFRFHEHLFLYDECVGIEISPSKLFLSLDKQLYSWPGKQEIKWSPMSDIFHGSQPLDLAQWQRGQKVEKYVARIGFLKPEKISSYIYYHYQLQEEQPPHMLVNKYMLIGLSRNILFLYDEKPATKGDLSYQGSLDTSNTPANWETWQQIMRSHFILWDDFPDFLRPCETILSR